MVILLLSHYHVYDHDTESERCHNLTKFCLDYKIFLLTQITQI